MKHSMDIYFSGEKLYGDDFTLDQIAEWYAAEEEGYANLGSNDKSKYRYPYHAMNKHFAFRHLPAGTQFQHALGFGSAYGEEFLPIIDRIKQLTIVEPSEQLRSEKLGDVVPTYVKPQVSGTFQFGDKSFDLVVSFSVLHHVPNVSHVLDELERVLAPGGILLIREPIRTMGDWRKPRPGLTKNERGIPLAMFERFIESKQLHVIKKSMCDCAFAHKIISKVLPVSKDTSSYQKFEEILSKLLTWNVVYHPVSPLKKCAPASVFMVLRKPS